MLRSHRRTTAQLAAVAFATSLSLTSNLSAKSWIGGNSSWNGAANWSPAGVPLVNEQVILNQGAFTVGYDAAVTPVVTGTVQIYNGMTLSQSSGTLQNGGMT